MELTIDPTLWGDVHRHLDNASERALFLFVGRASKGSEDWEVVDSWFLTEETDYQSVSGEHLALADEIPGQAIKRAHDAGAAIVEVHGHYWPGGDTRFSSYDIDGLTSLVPLVLWRLPGRPYFALVVGPESFDGLVWMSAEEVETVARVKIGDQNHLATGQSLQRYISYLGKSR
jgi:hypothetical protein